MPLPLEQLYDDHAQAVFAFLLNFTRSEADTRDVLQEVFCRIAKRPELLEGVESPRLFLIRLAQNSAIDLSRRRQTREKYHDSFAKAAPIIFEPGATVDEAAFHQALSEALAELPAEQRAVVHLKLWEEFTFEQIAEVLAISANTAASRYRYGLDKLRTLLRPLYDEIT